MKPLLKLSNITKRGEDRLVLRSVSFVQKHFEKIAVAGETGAGKSTLLKAIAGLAAYEAGQISLSGEKVISPDEKLVPGHPKIAYLSQHFELQKFLTVAQILEYASTIRAKEASEIYKVCRVSHLLDRKTNQLSGGERQRIALARLLTTAPNLLLLDEPFSNLDLIHKNQLKEVIDDISETLQITIILASHDPTDTLSWADTILVLKGGKLVQKGSPEVIYDKPKNAYIAGLFGKYNLFEPKQLHGIISEIPDGAENKKLLVRPEHLKIRRNGNEQGAFKGKIIAVQFYGSYFEIDIEWAGNRLTVKSDSGNYKTGDELWISASPEYFWYV